MSNQDMAQMNKLAAMDETATREERQAVLDYFATRIEQEQANARKQRDAIQSGSARQIKPQQSSSPKPGDVVKGHKFLGGDPADKANWVKQ